MRSTVATLITIALLGILSCDLPTFFGPPPDWHYDQPPVQQDTLLAPPDTCADYTPVDHPAFVQGYIEIDYTISTYRVLYAGPHRDTLWPGEDLLITVRMDSMLELWHPEYDYDVTTSPDGRVTSIVVEGTDDREWLFLQVYVRDSGWRIFMTFNHRSFFLGAAATYDILMDYAHRFPSVDKYNLRGAGMDSLQEIDVMLAILDSCKLGGTYVDWRFNNYPPTDSMHQAYKDADWDEIRLGIMSDHIDQRRDDPGHLIADLRYRCITEEEIRTLLRAGYVVIAGEPMGED